jgi:hypothetical protein
MTADEMLEKLGFVNKNPHCKTYMDYERKETYSYSIITFYIHRRVFCGTCGYEPLEFNVEMLQAIHQKMIELGWIECNP